MWGFSPGACCQGAFYLLPIRHRAIRHRLTGRRPIRHCSPTERKLYLHWYDNYGNNAGPLCKSPELTEKATLRRSVNACSLIFICFCKQQLLLAEINHVIYFSQSQFLLTKTNEDRTASQKALYPSYQSMYVIKMST